MSSVEPAAPPLFCVERATYRYPGGELGMSDVDLAIESGQRVVLLGANGCGKSTLLMVLDGLLFPQEGTVRALGEPLTEASLAVEAVNAAFRRQVGLVFQNAEAQLFSASVWEEIAFGPLHMGWGSRSDH